MLSRRSFVGLGPGNFILGLTVSSCLAIAVASDQQQRPDLSVEDQARVAAVTAPATRFDAAEPFESMQAGAATSKTPFDRNAFSQMQPNLNFAQRETFNLGNALFRKLWVSSPASTQSSDGLGPLFNARSCQSCHIKDGRGQLPVAGEPASSFLVQLGRRRGSDEPWNGDEHYGKQLQTVGIPGHKAEARIDISHADREVRFDDGTIVTLRNPTYRAIDLAYGPLDSNTGLTPRLAPPMIGMGLLEAISDTDILSREDPDDADEDGISGRASRIADDLDDGDEDGISGLASRKVDEQGVKLGRFGLKAAKATVHEQSANAFTTDMGLSNPLHPVNSGDCTTAQAKCLNAPDGEQPRFGKTEVPEKLMDLVTFYSSNLAPPARRDVDDPAVLRGKQAFYEAGCTGCHTPKYVTSRDAPEEAHRFQLIWPYTDMLVHDMGEALADEVGVHGGVNDGVAAAEWRTPPLWGLGLTKTVNPRASFLHDGRARTLMEAVLWHGGEGEASRDKVLAMSSAERESLIKFLESL